MNRTVTSNGAPIPYTPKYFGRLRDTNLADVSEDELRARYAEDGYVLLRGLLSASKVQELRAHYLDLVDTDTKPSQRYGTKGHPAYDFVREAAFRDFVDQPVFRAVAERLTGGSVAPIRRTPLRHFVPGSQVASRAHVDGTYIDGAATDVVTIWTPIGDCSVEAGSLMYLEGSHTDSDLISRVRGDAPTDRANDTRPITHDLKWLADTTERRWLAADFAAGDVVVHAPTIIHATLDTATQVRVSADIRFQRMDTPKDPRWDQDWSADDGY